jgi:hypothetical protein
MEDVVVLFVAPPNVVDQLVPTGRPVSSNVTG